MSRSRITHLRRWISVCASACAFLTGFGGVAPPAGPPTTGERILSEASKWAGTPYCFYGGNTGGPTLGTTDPENGLRCGSSGYDPSATPGFDCTGLTLYAAYRATEKVLAHSGSQASDAVSQGGQRIDNPTELQPGDLVYFGGSFGSFVHSGVYAGVAKEGKPAFWSAVTEGIGVALETMAWEESAEPFVGGVRFGGGAGSIGEGSFVRVTGSNEVFRIVGGAPLYISGWGAFGGEQPTSPISQQELEGLPQYPRNGTAVYAAGTGAGYVFAGGAPLYVASWGSVGNPSPFEVDGYALEHYGSGNLSHVRQYPADGTAVWNGAPGEEHGAGYVFAGGAPLFVSNWASAGEPQAVEVDGYALEHYGAGNLSHVRQFPADGAAVWNGAAGEEHGAGYVFAGGAPLYVSNWASAGDPPAVEIDGYALEHYGPGHLSHVRHFPADGTAVWNGASGEEHGAGYVFAGGAPLFVSNWASVGEPSAVEVDGYALEHYGAGNLSHVRQFPADGTAVWNGAPGEEHGAGYVFAGGAPLFVSNWTSVGEPSAVEVDGYALEHYGAGNVSHVRPRPANGTFVNAHASNGEEAGAYVIAGGTPFSINSWEVFGGEPIGVVVIDAWDLANDTNPRAHLQPLPGDGTVVEGLPSHTLWTFRAGVRRHGGTTTEATQVADGGLESFARAAPVVATALPANVTPESAELRSTVNPEGEPVSECRFEYGATEAYGSSIPCSALPGEGESPVGVLAIVEGLSPATSYHFRVAAVGAGGTTYGSDATFTTERLQPPEFGRCLAVTAGKGRYGTAGCTAEGGTKSHEWALAFGGSAPLAKAGFTTQLKPATKLILETKGKAKVTCTGESSGGAYTGLKTVANLTLKLTGCQKAAGAACTSSGAAPGEVVTSTLSGQLGVLKTESPATKDKIGLELKSASDETIAEFACSYTPVTLRGAVIVEVKANTMLSTATLGLAQAKGIQKWTHFEGGPTAMLEAQVGGGSYEQTGLALTTVQTNEEKLEVSSVV